MKQKTIIYHLNALMDVGISTEHINSIRADTKSTLENLSDFRHIVVQEGLSEKRILSLLEEADIADKFEKVVGEDNFRLMDYHYAPILYGMNAREASRDVMIHGRTALSGDVNHKNTVYLYHPSATAHSAKLVEKVVEILLDQGNGNFYKGFKKILGRMGLSDFYRLKRSTRFKSQGIDASFFRDQVPGKGSYPEIDIGSARKYYAAQEKIR